MTSKFHQSDWKKQRDGLQYLKYITYPYKIYDLYIYYLYVYIYIYKIYTHVYTHLSNSWVYWAYRQILRPLTHQIPWIGSHLQIDPFLALQIHLCIYIYIHVNIPLIKPEASLVELHTQLSNLNEHVETTNFLGPWLPFCLKTPRMEGHDSRPNVISFSGVISACEKGHHWSQVRSSEG